MKIGIIGGGSIGLLFAYYLSEKCQVTIFTNTSEQAEAIRKEGIHLINKDQKFTRNIEAKTFEQWTDEEDVTVIAVKQYHLKTIVQRFLQFPQLKSKLLFVQNGMGHLHLLNDIPADTILVSSVEHGAYKENLFTVRHNGVGLTRIASFKGTYLFLQEMVGISNFSIEFELDYYEMLVRKLLANAVINPLSALLKVQNGDLIRNKHYFTSFKNLFNEVAAILSLENQEQYFEQIIRICQNTATNRSSMLKDLEANRLTEVDAIIGFLLDEAEQHNKEAPICRLLYHLIKGEENRGEEKWGS